MTERRRSEVSQTALGFCPSAANADEVLGPPGFGVGEKLPNGATIVAAEPNGEYVVVLAIRDDSYLAQYVTWKVDPDTGNAFWGDYFASIGAAVRNFNERVAN